MGVYCQNWEIHIPVHLPYLYLEVARIPPSSQDYIFRSLRNDQRSKENELSSKPLSPGRAREIPKKKLDFFIYRQQRLFFRRRKKIILSLLFRTFGHTLESQSTQKHVYTDILPDPVVSFSKRSCCFEIVLAGFYFQNGNGQLFVGFNLCGFVSDYKVDHPSY